MAAAANAAVADAAVADAADAAPPMPSGFDLAAKLIEDAVLRQNPKLVLPPSARYDKATATKKDRAAAVAAAKAETEKQLHSMKSNFEASVKSKFQSGGGRRTTPKASLSPVDLDRGSSGAV